MRVLQALSRKPMIKRLITRKMTVPRLIVALDYRDLKYYCRGVAWECLPYVQAVDVEDCIE